MNTPRFEYSQSVIQQKITELKSLSAPFGLTVRYAIKANPHSEIIKIMNHSGVHFDASSSYEAELLINHGVKPDRISLSSQQSPHNLESFLKNGGLFVATSFKQIELFLQTKTRPKNLGIRINPDLGKGHNNRTSTGGTSASFGIWYEYIDQVLQMTKIQNVIIDRLHIHTGSGADPTIWSNIMDRALHLLIKLPDVTALDIGGGFKVSRYQDGAEANMTEIFKVFETKLLNFEKQTNRKIHLEIEPGTYFIAHAGTLIASIDDIVDTGENGYTFLRLNTGMNDFLRSSMYGSRHKIEVINNSKQTKEYVVVGHNCESGDILTPTAGDPEQIETRTLNQAQIGDEIRIYDVGAYGYSMNAKGYNSFPSATEKIIA